MPPNYLTRLAALLLALPALAPAQPEPEAPPRYNVEVIVFAHTDVDPAEELFEDEQAATESGRPNPSPRDVLAIEPFGTGLPLPRLATEPAAETDAPGTASTPAVPGDVNPDPAADPTASGADPLAASDPLAFIDPFGRLGTPDAGDNGSPPPFRVLRPAELELGDAHGIIDRLGAYRLLGHGGWQQFGLPENEAMAVDLARLGIRNPTGSIKLYLGRFLHVRIDLDYRDGAGGTITPAAGDGRVATPPDAFPGRYPSLAQFTLPQRYRLETERNAIRSGELHYVDHPRFGVLLRVTPAPADPEESQAGEDDTAPSA